MPEKKTLSAVEVLELLVGRIEHIERDAAAVRKVLTAMIEKNRRSRG